MYLVKDEELEHLKKGKTKIKDIAKADNIALITWSGEDIRGLLKQKKIELSEEQFEDFVDGINHNCGHLNCGDCIKIVFEDLLDEGEWKELKVIKGGKKDD